MKKQYVVICTNGYIKAENKKDAMEILENDEKAMYVIHTRSQEGNYYHNRIKIVA